MGRAPRGGFRRRHPGGLRHGRRLQRVYAERPDYVSSLIADKTTGLALVNAVLAALFHRERTGEGQYVETPMLETMAAFVLAEHMGGMTFEPREGAVGYARLGCGAGAAPCRRKTAGSPCCPPQPSTGRRSFRRSAAWTW